MYSFSMYHWEATANGLRGKGRGRSLGEYGDRSPTGASANKAAPQLVHRKGNESNEVRKAEKRRARACPNQLAAVGRAYFVFGVGQLHDLFAYLLEGLAAA